MLHREIRVKRLLLALDRSTGQRRVAVKKALFRLWYTPLDSEVWRGSRDFRGFTGRRSS